MLIGEHNLNLYLRLHQPLSESLHISSCGDRTGMYRTRVSTYKLHNVKETLILAFKMTCKRWNSATLHTGPWIRIRCGSGIRIQRLLCLHMSNARSLRAVWSSRAITLNLDRGSGSSESVFSARVESPIGTFEGGFFFKTTLSTQFRF